jgi:hypothetical protein
MQKDSAGNPSASRFSTVLVLPSGVTTSTACGADDVALIPIASGLDTEP